MFSIQLCDSWEKISVLFWCQCFRLQLSLSLLWTKQLLKKAFSVFVVSGQNLILSSLSGYSSAWESMFSYFSASWQECREIKLEINLITEQRMTSNINFHTNWKKKKLREKHSLWKQISWTYCNTHTHTHVSPQDQSLHLLLSLLLIYCANWLTHKTSIVINQLIWQKWAQQ